MEFILLGDSIVSMMNALLVAAVLSSLAILFLTVVLLQWGSYWLQAYVSGAKVSMKSLIVMSLLKIDHRMIVNAKVMGRQAGLRIDREEGGMTTERLQAHSLAGGDVMKVIQAIIAAQRAGIALDFDRAAAIDLAGRDVLQAIQTSISPKCIRCPSGIESTKGDKGTERGANQTLGAVAKNGVELRVSARVTVRTNWERLVGGATEETIIARVGQGIVSAIGSAASHMDVLAMPSQISKSVLANGLDQNTAFEIVSIDIASIDVGENIGARLQTDQADADTRIARALAEGRRAQAVALTQEMRAKVVERKAELKRAEAEIPSAIANAFEMGTPFPRKT